jgi:hypothetical protein
MLCQIKGRDATKLLRPLLSLCAKVHEAEPRAWAALHADFIAALNARIEHDGLPLDEHRMFS